MRSLLAAPYFAQTIMWRLQDFFFRSLAKPLWCTQSPVKKRVFLLCLLILFLFLTLSLPSWHPGRNVGRGSLQFVYSVHQFFFLNNTPPPPHKRETAKKPPEQNKEKHKKQQQQNPPHK